MVAEDQGCVLERGDYDAVEYRRILYAVDLALGCSLLLYALVRIVACALRGGGSSEAEEDLAQGFEGPRLPDWKKSPDYSSVLYP